MPRGRSIRKRTIQPDIVYGDMRLAKFINYVMLDGKKDKARKIVYGALDAAAEKAKVDQLELLEVSLKNVKPDVEVRPRRVGGATYQIPVPVTRGRGESLALGWIIDAARSRKGASMQQKLANELLNAYNGEGAAITKKENTHKMAESNRAFAHFRW